jgi:hypothetical protein
MAWLECIRRCPCRCAVFVLCLSSWSLSIGVGLSSPNENSKVLINLPQVDRNICQHRTPRCDQMITQGALYPTQLYFAFIMVADADKESGIGSVRCGIDYNGSAGIGVEVYGWTLCASWEVGAPGVNGPWPAPLSGNLIQWDVETSCQQFESGGAGTGVLAKAGFFYVGAYTSDNLSVVVHPSDGLVVVESCASVVDTVEGGPVVRNPSHLGYARFSEGGTEPGYNPCGLGVPVRATTWGRIKATY